MTTDGFKGLKGRRMYGSALHSLLPTCLAVHVRNMYIHLFTNRENAKRHVGLKIQVAQDEQVSLAFLVHTFGLQHFICHPCCFMKVQNFVTLTREEPSLY